jgi:hypothetical protein
MGTALSQMLGRWERAAPICPCLMERVSSCGFDQQSHFHGLRGEAVHRSLRFHRLTSSGAASLTETLSEERMCLLLPARLLRR